MGIFDFFKSSKEEKINNSVNNNVQNLANKYMGIFKKSFFSRLFGNLRKGDIEKDSRLLS